MIISPVKLHSKRLIQTAESRRVPDIISRTKFDLSNASRFDSFNITTDNINQLTTERREDPKINLMMKNSSYEDKMNSTFQMPILKRNSMFTTEEFYQYPIDEDIHENVASSGSITEII